MEKRNSERIKIHRQIRLNDKAAMLVNINRLGLQLIIATPPKYKKATLVIVDEGIQIKLEGIICWAQRVPGVRAMIQLGITIKEADNEFYDLVDKIS